MIIRLNVLLYTTLKLLLYFQMLTSCDMRLYYKEINTIYQDSTNRFERDKIPPHGTIRKFEFHIIQYFIQFVKYSTVKFIIVRSRVYLFTVMTSSRVLFIVKMQCGHV